MSVLTNKNQTELIVTCHCGCEESVHIRIDKEDYDNYAITSFMNGNWYRDQNDRVIKTIWRKLKKIWSIIRNKDFYYSEITMNKNEFEEFKKYINSI